MEVLAERARQALGLGSKEFDPTNLDSHHKMLADLGPEADLVTKYHKAIRSFDEVATVFLQSSSKVLVDTPYPRTFYQTSLSSEAHPTFTPIPREHMKLFTRDVHEHLGETVPRTVDNTIQHKLLTPIEHWLKAFESAKERVHNLDKARLQYDAARRKVLATLSDTGISEREKELRLINREKEHEARMAHFEVEEANTYAQLLWLTSQGARLKAHLADLLNYMYTSALSHKQEPLILEPFPLRVLETPSEQLKRLCRERGLPPAGPPSVEGDDVPAPELLLPRKEHPYEGEGTGHKETRLTPEAVHFGLGVASRKSASLPPTIVGDIPPWMHDISSEVERPVIEEEVSRAKDLQIIPSPRQEPHTPPPPTGTPVEPTPSGRALTVPDTGAITEPRAPEQQPAIVHRVVTAGKSQEGVEPEVVTRSSVVATEAQDENGKGVAVVTTRTMTTVEGGTPKEAVTLANQAGKIAGMTAAEAAQQRIEGRPEEEGPSVTARLEEGMKEGAKWVKDEAADVAGKARQGAASLAVKTKEVVGLAGAKTKEVLVDRPREAFMDRYELAKERRQQQKEEELLAKAQEWKEKFGGALLLPLSQEELEELRQARDELHTLFVLSRASQIQTAEELEALWRRAEAAEAAQIESRTRALHDTFASDRQVSSAGEHTTGDMRWTRGRLPHVGGERGDTASRTAPLLGLSHEALVQRRALGAMEEGGIEAACGGEAEPQTGEWAPETREQPTGQQPVPGHISETRGAEGGEEEQTGERAPETREQPTGQQPVTGRISETRGAEGGEEEQAGSAALKPGGLVAQLQQTVQSEQAGAVDLNDGASE